MLLAGSLVALAAWLAPLRTSPRASVRACDAAARPPPAATGLPNGRIGCDTSFEVGPLPPVGETLRKLLPKSVTVVPLDVHKPMQVPLVDPSSTFVELFRSCTPYIKMHQGRTMVIHVASEVLDDKELFDSLMEEVAVLALLGVRPVLLVGTRVQIDATIRQRGMPPGINREGVRQTDEATMRVVQEVSGFVRSRVEGALARGRARSGPGGSVGVDVVGGNFFYTAQPVGVRDGVDYGYTGEVRVHARAARAQRCTAADGWVGRRV